MGKIFVFALWFLSVLLTTSVFAKENLPTAKTVAALRTISSENIKITCETQVLELLSKLETPTEWIAITGPLISSEKNFRLFKSATENKNVVLDLATADGQTRVKRSDLRNIVIYDFTTASKCEMKMSVHKFDIPKSKKLPEFTDIEVGKLIKESAQNRSTTLFYLWSPNMNISVKGVNEIKQVAQEMGMKLVVMADSSAADDRIKKTAMAEGWPWDYGYTLEADLLKSRNMGIHFPALIVLKNGELSESMRPGYDAPERLKKFLSSIK
jgi:hypothetical protein